MRQYRAYGLVAVCLAVFFLASLSEALIRVPEDYSSIQDAIDAAGFGETVQVGSGTFRENIVLKEGVVLEGEGEAFTTIQGDRHYHTVVMADDASILGFTIEGAPSCVYTTAQNVVIADNTLVGSYFGLLCQGGSLQVQDNDVAGAPAFVGIHCQDASGTIENCYVRGAYLGIKLLDCDVTVVRCAIEGTDNGINVESTTGSLLNSYLLNNNFDGVLLHDSSFLVANCVVYAKDHQLARGILCKGPGAIIANTIISDCRLGIVADASANPYILYNDLWNNQDGACVGFDEQPFDPWPGTGQLGVDPLFVDPSAKDFRLQEGSQCIDAGYTSGDYRDQDSSPTDIGAHGGPEAGWVGHRRPPSIEVSVNRDVVGAWDGEPFVLSISYSNMGADAIEVDKYIAVKASFGLFYLPWFSQEPMAERVMLEPTYGKTEEVLSIDDTASIPVDDYTFYAAFARPGTFDFYGGISSCQMKRVNKPFASFVVTPTEGRLGDTNFRFDASASWDEEDGTGPLRVRWDWTNDGSWDTNWSIKKTAEHRYYSGGPKITIRLEGMDTDGYTDTTTRQITVTE